MASKHLIDANGNHVIKASDNTDHSLCFSDGIISVMDEHGHCICEFHAEDIPSEDAAAVVHAHWIDDTFCSNCRHFAEDYEGHIILSFSDWCPGCGAKMDLKGK